MRPGQTAPECLNERTKEQIEAVASMRPGQTAPECRRCDEIFAPNLQASMRPGQTAPECFPQYGIIPREIVQLQ